MLVEGHGRIFASAGWIMGMHSIGSNGSLLVPLDDGWAVRDEIRNF
jgi:hypothetical protein